MKIRSILLLVSLLFVSQSFAPKKSVELRLDLPKGKTIEMEMKLNMTFFTDRKLTQQMMSQNINMKNRIEVVDKTTDGVHEVKYSLTHIKLKQDMQGRTSTYDSDSVDSSDPVASSMHQQFGDKINNPVDIKIDELGELVKEGSDSSALEQFPGTNNLFIKFPEKAVSEGDSWTKNQTMNAGGNEISVDLRYAVQEIKSDVVILDVKVVEGSLSTNGEMPDMDLEQKGTITIDRKTGQPLQMTMNQMLELNNPQMGQVFMVSESEFNTNK